MALHGREPQRAGDLVGTTVGDRFEEARAALALSVVDDLRATGLALGSRIATVRGLADDALRLATEAREVDAHCSDLELTHGMCGLALAEAHAARGDHVGARAAAPPLHRASACQRPNRAPRPRAPLLGRGRCLTS